MRKILLLISLFFVSFLAQAVTLSSDAITDPNVTAAAVSLNGGPFVDTPIVAGKVAFNVAAAVVGGNNVNVKLVVVDPLWGRLESTATNFTFSRPGVPTSVSGLLLIN